MKLVEKIKAHLVDNIAVINKKWSIWLSTSSGILLLFVQILPHSYNDLPQWVQDIIPHDFVPVVAILLVFASVLAQYLKQKNLNKEDCNDESKPK